jgi:prephenate dehydrogenase
VAIDAETHDRLLAVVSHLPHAIANVLVAQAAGALGDAEQRRVPAVGPSFRDATRVAGANSAIWTDIYLANADALIAAIDSFGERLGEMRASLVARDAKALTAWNDAARADRDELLGAGMTGGPVSELRAAVPNNPGVIAEIALALGRAGVNIRDLALSPSEDRRQGVVALWIGGEQEAARAEQLIGDLGFPVARA